MERELRTRSATSRVLNVNGNFSFVTLDTVSFRLSKGRAIMEYDVVKEDGTYDFQEVFLEQNSFLVFCFVRGDGTIPELINFI